MPNPFVIRSIAENDFNQWKILWDGYNQFYGRSGATALSPEITRTTWSRLLESSEPVNALVAEGPDGLLGLAHFIYHRSTIQIGASCYMQDLFTDAEARGKGVGSALISEVYQRALAHGSPRVYWQTHESNLAAMKLYDKVAEKSGFLVYRKTLNQPS
ncbi:GNAT family N-acetyltransferase [Xylophilus sp. Kf1]|nr:GNAT family N-acetyltransferase [Xylophilus sp. Kf1]